VSVIQTPQGAYLSTLLAEHGVAEHCFGTASADPPRPWLELKQVHSARVIAAEQWQPGLEADALISSRGGTRLVVKTADCVPILLLDPVRRAVAAVHAGWRGAVQGIAAAAVREMGRLYGSRPEDIVAALGPAIGGCCYEVGPEVAVQFRDWFPERNDLERRTRIDLRLALRRQLAGAGLEEARIDTAEACTCCGGGQFHSWRRDGARAGRMFSAIALMGDA
jgi:YfiH family protein